MADDTIIASDISDDHQRILALAKAVFTARDDAARWTQSPENQLGHHDACCQALWDELERLVEINDGKVPTLENPAERERRIAKNISIGVISEILDIAKERLTQDVCGSDVWSEPGALSLVDDEGIW